MSGHDKEDYEVGYGKPPKNRQFGASDGNRINRRGRRKGSRNQKTVFKNFMERPLPGNQKINIREALWMTLLQKALTEKSERAIKAFIDMDMKLCPEVYSNPHEAGQMQTGVLVVPEGVSMDEYLEKAKEYRQKMLEDQEKFAWEVSQER